MSFKSKVLYTLIILGLLNIHLGVGAAPADSGKIVKLLSIGVSELTKKHLVMQIKATGPVQYRNTVLKKIPEENIIIFYVDMPNTHSCIDGGGLVKITPFTQPSNLFVDVPVIKINVSQFRLDPSPISRVVFYLKKPIRPTITAKDNSLSFTFPITSAPERQPESPAEVKQPEAKERPAVITQVKPVFESKVTKLRIISDKQLNFKHVVSGEVPPNAGIEAILELDFVNATSSLRRRFPSSEKALFER